MGKQKILVIDDDDTILSIVQATLEKDGFEILLAHNGQEGLEKAANDGPDGIILDRKMPDMDGNAVLMQLKDDEKTKDIPVIMLTSKTAISDVASSLDLGAADYIVKPFDHDNLALRVSNMLDQG